MPSMSTFTIIFVVFSCVKIAAGVEKFQTALIRDDGTICSGTLITSSFVLTTDFCVHRAKEIDVIIGSDDLLKADPTDVVFICTEFIINGLAALIKLPSTVKTADTDIKPISYRPLAPNDELYISSWIYSDGETKLQLKLQKSKIAVTDWGKCKILESYTKTNKSFCATAHMNQQLLGDFGSPVYSFGGNLQHTWNYSFVGIIYVMAEHDDLAVVLQLDDYKDWIGNITSFDDY